MKNNIEEGKSRNIVKEVAKKLVRPFTIVTLLSTGGVFAAGCEGRTENNFITVPPITIAAPAGTPTPTPEAKPAPTSRPARAPQVQSSPARTPEITTTPSATINADPADRSYEPGTVIYADSNYIFVADPIIDNVKACDDRNDTGLVVDMRTNAKVELPWGGGVFIRSDSAKKAAEIEKQKRLIELGGRRADVIVWYGGPNQQTQGFPQTDWNDPNWRNWNNEGISPDGRVAVGAVINVGPLDFFEGDAWVVYNGSTYYPLDDRLDTGLILDFKVFAEVKALYGGRLVRCKSLLDKMIKIEEARSRMTDEGVLATRAPYRVDVRDFVGGIEQKNQRGY